MLSRKDRTMKGLYRFLLGMAIVMQLVWAAPAYSGSGDFTPTDGDVDGSDLAALIASPSLLDVETFAWNFGLTAGPTVNDYNNYRVFQRAIGGTTKSVTVSGTFSNLHWDRVEARILQHGTNTAVVGWTTIDYSSSPGDTAFSGSLTVPQGGWYNVEIRALDVSGSVIGSARGTNKWGVGMNILVIGQSNMSGNGGKPFTVEIGRAHV